MLGPALLLSCVGPSYSLKLLYDSVIFQKKYLPQHKTGSPSCYEVANQHPSTFYFSGSIQMVLRQDPIPHLGNQMEENDSIYSLSIGRTGMWLRILIKQTFES